MRSRRDARVLRNVHRPAETLPSRSGEEVLESIRRCGEQFGEGVKRVLLADGDAMTLSIRRLATVPPKAGDEFLFAVENCV